jgi:hypothetical protein
MVDTVVMTFFGGFSDKETRRSLRFCCWAPLDPNLVVRNAETMDFHEILLFVRA